MGKLGVLSDFSAPREPIFMVPQLQLNPRQRQPPESGYPRCTPLNIMLSLSRKMRIIVASS